MTNFSHREIKSPYPTSSPAFTCPLCKGFASHKWTAWCEHKRSISIEKGKSAYISSYIIDSVCEACNNHSFWIKNSYEEFLIYPKINKNIPEPNSDMPLEIKDIYIEAGTILNDSPRASAALSRLAIDKLTKQLAPEGKDLNKRIGLLVERGLPIEIQQSFDVVRVVGNNAIHPGEIDLSDNKEMAVVLLELLNIIVDNRISQPKRISEMYSNLPQGALEAIAKRDRKD